MIEVYTQNVTVPAMTAIPLEQLEILFASFIKMGQVKFKLRQVQHQQVKQTLCICHSQRLFKYHKIILAIVLLLRLQYK